MNKSAIIIGAGIGGITTALYLAKNGYDVNVYEKNPSPGGRCGHIVRDCHRFDLGATIFAMPTIYRHVFESLGLKLEDCFEITELSNIIKIHFSCKSGIGRSCKKVETTIFCKKFITKFNN